MRHTHAISQSFQGGSIKTLVSFERSIVFLALHKRCPTIIHGRLLLRFHKLLSGRHHRLQFQHPRFNLLVEQLLVFVSRSLTLRHHLNVLLQLSEQLLKRCAITVFILLHRLRHILMIIPTEIGRKRLISLTQRSVFGESILKRLFPRRHIVELGIVPRIVCHREERDARHHALLHGIGHHSKTILQFLLQTRVIIDSAHLHEVGVHVGGVNLLIGVVIARIVPPPSHRTTKFGVHRCQIIAVWHSPHAPSCGVDGDVGRHSRQSFEETLTVSFAHPTQGVNLWHEVQRTHAIFGCTARFVPLRIDGILHCGEMVCIRFAFRFRMRHTHVVHEDRKLAHAQVVHTRKLLHNARHHIGLPHKIIAWVDSPDEIHLGRLRGFRQILHHILRHSAIFDVRLHQRLGVRFFPFRRVIQVRLRPIHIGVHLQAHHKAHQRLFHRQIVGITIITFHQSATLLIGIVEERHSRQLLRTAF